MRGGGSGRKERARGEVPTPTPPELYVFAVFSTIRNGLVAVFSTRGFHHTEESRPVGVLRFGCWGGGSSVSIPWSPRGVATLRPRFGGVASGTLPPESEDAFEAPWLGGLIIRSVGPEGW